MEPNSPELQQLQQWSFNKPYGRGERSDSAATSPDPEDVERLRITPGATELNEALEKETLFQERYMSSEEDLSPGELSSWDSEDDDDISIHEGEEFSMAKETLSTESSYRRKNGDLAIVISMVSVGKPKVVDVPLSPIPDFRPCRSSSLANAMPVLRIPGSRLSTISISSPTSPRRPSTARAFPIQSSFSSEIPSPLASELSQEEEEPITSPIVQEESRPKNRNSTHIPIRVDIPSFLDSDPYASRIGAFPNSLRSSKTESSPKSPHKRLRSISKSLSLAKIAIAQKVEGRSNPKTPLTPATPSSSFSSPYMPKNRQRMVARGANEREPTLELPPFPDETDGDTEASSGEFDVKQLRVRRRKSLLNLGLD
ncbi:hypothetical protein M501DRAFT_1014138 [Patellaria atrata CBS 101060]|uniref:Uncharacterized protein n=1 Tax=Patellaria atrata CBS 101060 TaxID=1346257 RepID=A0A9P4VRU7_9PEZI|nr:hypothetical protein M501DRAFT_1014138 [Patellaria atrata CBS 101060]